MKEEEEEEEKKKKKKNKKNKKNQEENDFSVLPCCPRLVRGCITFIKSFISANRCMPEMRLSEGKAAPATCSLSLQTSPRHCL